ncbi:preprotein translocase subunit TatA [Haloprofundus marisrubri]|uniref:Sec-independent protein translocase protein TatA n=1 Tax=Haloprofundus marisrubri TaxID=1514971 RepID=A0A0W1R9J8_9EURY|nr:twin-arginine translocase TatA/TatE family subunit [Haloprofundus marisrubri]KTG09995.1 preprotein translocase subunit TatA [Haloprofundus marisrubri]
MTFVLFGALPGGPELLIILLIIVLLFGANKLPELARSTGQAMGEFQRGRDDIERELRQSSTSEARESASAPTTPSTDDDTDTESETEAGDESRSSN